MSCVPLAQILSFLVIQTGTTLLGQAIMGIIHALIFAFPGFSEGGPEVQGGAITAIKTSGACTT